MPVLDAGGNGDDCAGQQLLSLLAPLLIPAAPRGAEQDLPAALCGAVYVPVVAAARLKGHIGDAYAVEISENFKIGSPHKK